MKLFGDLFPGRKTATETLRKDDPPALVPKVNLTMEMMIDPGWKLLHEVKNVNSHTVTVMPDMTELMIDMVVQNGGTVNTFRRIELYHKRYNTQYCVSIYVPHNRHWPARLLEMVDVETTMRMRSLFNDAFESIPELAHLINRCTTPDDFRRLLKECLRQAKNSPHIRMKG